MSELPSIFILGPQFSTFVRSVQLLCEEKSLPYELGVEYQGKEYAFGSENFKSLHPFCKAPVVFVDGRPMYETASVMRYLHTLSGGEC